MNSVLLYSTARLLVPIQILFSIYLLLRGHNEPGGGFVAGLVAGSAFLLLGLSKGFSKEQGSTALSWTALITIGLSAALLSGAIAITFGLHSGDCNYGFIVAGSADTASSTAGATPGFLHNSNSS